MPQTFHRLLRLQTSADFQKVWKTGKRVSVPCLAIISCANKLGYPRLGMNIPKKNIRSAVDRNRLRRLARETFRIRQDKLDSRDIVVIAYKGAETLTPTEQYQCFNRLWDLFIKQFGTA